MPRPPPSQGARTYAVAGTLVVAVALCAFALSNPLAQFDPLHPTLAPLIYLTVGLLIHPALGLVVLIAALPLALLGDIAISGEVLVVMLFESLLVPLGARYLHPIKSITLFWSVITLGLLLGMELLDGGANLVASLAPLIAWQALIAIVSIGLALLLGELAGMQPEWRRQRVFGLRARLFHVMLTGLLTVMMLTVFVLGTRLLDQARSEAQTLLASRANALSQAAEDFILLHLRAVEAAALLGAEVADNPRQMWQRLEAMRRAFPGFASLLATDANGNVTALSHSGDYETDLAFARRAANVSDRSYFYAIASGEPRHVSAAFEGRGIGPDVLVAVSHPLSVDGRFLGVVEGSLLLDRLPELFPPLPGDQAVQAVVVDSAGRVVYSTIESLPPMARFERNTLADWDQVLRAPSGVSGWSVVTLVNTRQLLISGTNLARWLLLVMGASVLLAILLANLLAREVVDPLHALSDTIRHRLTNPDSDLTLPLKAHPTLPIEIHQLIKRFNALLRRLESQPVPTPSNEAQSTSGARAGRAIVALDDPVLARLLCAQLRQIGVEASPEGSVERQGDELYFVQGGTRERGDVGRTICVTTSEDREVDEPCLRLPTTRRELRTLLAELDATEPAGMLDAATLRLWAESLGGPEAVSERLVSAAERARREIASACEDGEATKVANVLHYWSGKLGALGGAGVATVLRHCENALEREQTTVPQVRRRVLAAIDIFARAAQNLQSEMLRATA